MRRLAALILLTLTLLSLANIALAANDPGHDTLYIEEEGSSELNGSLNITQDLKVAQRIYSDYLDVRGDGTVTGSYNRIIGQNGQLYIESSGDIIFNDQLGTTSTVKVGGTGDSVALAVTGPITQGGVAVCLSNGTNCVNGNNTGNVSSVTAGSGLTNSGTASDPVLNVGAGNGITVNADSVAIDPTYTQRRVTGTCNAGEAIQTINQDGTVTCQATSGASTAGGWTNTSTTTSTDLNVEVSDGNLTVVSGRVGVGISSPVAAVDIRSGDMYVLGASNRRVLIGDGVSSGQWGGFRWDSSSDTISFGHSASSSNVQNIVVDSSGRVGINDSTPSMTLDVKGNIGVSGSEVISSSGVWSGSTITVAKGGTGLSSSTEDAVMVGSGTSAWQAKTLPDCTSGFLQYDQSTNSFSCGSESGTGNLSGSGTTGTIPKWTGAATLGDSIITDDGSTASVAGGLDVTGTITVGTNNLIRDSGGMIEVYSDNTAGDYIELQSNSNTYGVIIREDATNGGSEWGNIEVRDGKMNIGFNNAAGGLVLDDNDCVRIDSGGGSCSNTEGLTIDGILRVSGTGTSTFAGNITINGGEQVCTASNGLCTSGATANSGTANKIAYYSGANTIDSLAGSNNGALYYDASGNIQSGTLPIASGGTGATTLNDLITLGTHTTGNYIATITGGTGIDVTGSGSESAATTISLNDSGVTAGSYGSASNVATFTVDAQGRLTSASSTSIAIDASQITTGTLDSARLSGSYTGITGVGTITAGTWQGNAITDTYISGAATWNAKAGTGTCPDGEVVMNTTTSGVQCVAVGTGNMDSWTIAGDSGSDTVSNGQTVTIAGGTNGIDTSESGRTITLNLDWSEVSDNTIAWSKVSKTSSSLADLATRSASDLNSGTLAVARGGTGLTSSTEDAVMVGSGTSAWQAKTLPDCTSGFLQYDQSTNSFGCGSESGTGDITAVNAGTGLTGGGTTGEVTLNLNTTYTSARYVNRSDWTTIDDYPTACSSGYYVRGIGDTLTCVADDDTPDSDAEVPDAITVSGGTLGSNTISSGATWTTSGTLTIGDGDDRIDIDSDTWDVTDGTITGATWQGNAITDSYISSAGTWNAKAGTGTCPDGEVVMNTTTSGVQCVAVGTGDITAVNAGTGLTGGGTTGDVTLNLNTTGVTAGTYGSGSEIPVLTIDTTGRVTSASTSSFSESDPQVGAVTNAQWCVGDGSAVQCNQAAPDTSTSNELQTLSEVLGQGNSAGSYAIDMNNQLIQNIGAAGTDFTSGGGLTVAGAFTASSTAALNGGTTLGDASSDSLTINSAAASIPNNLSFDSGTLFVDSTNDRVGVGTTTPYYQLEILNSSSNGAFGISTSGNNGDIFVVDERGYVGVGIAEPEAKFHIIDSGVAATPPVHIEAQGSSDAAIRLEVSKANTFTLGVDESDNYFKIADNTALGTNDRLVIDTSGLIGIGTTTPRAKLDVNGNASINNTLYVTTDGKVGIGTANPQAKVDIVGDSILVQDSAADLSAKKMMLGITQYNTSEEPVNVIGAAVGSSYNSIYVGGGSSSANTATRISFFTASDTKTTTGTERLRITKDGNVRVGTGTPENASGAGDLYVTSDIEADGNIYYAGTLYSTSSDLAEKIPADEKLEAGEVVELDPEHPGKIRKSTEAYSSLVAGVVSTQPATVLGSEEEGPAIALAGRVPVRVNDENGPIRVGDYLVASSTPGEAMGCRLRDVAAAEDFNQLKSILAANEQCRNAAFAKAMEPLDDEKGLITGLVLSQ